MKLRVLENKIKVMHRLESLHFTLHEMQKKISKYNCADVEVSHSAYIEDSAWIPASVFHLCLPNMQSTVLKVLLEIKAELKEFGIVFEQEEHQEGEETNDGQR